MLNNKLVQNSAHWSSSFTKLNLTVDELKASNSKLEKEMAKERDDRKVETDRLEASNSKLEKELAKERDDRKVETDRLEEELAKERDDRKVETDRLEERLEEQDQLHTTRLAEEKATRSRDVQSITEV